MFLLVNGWALPCFRIGTLFVCLTNGDRDPEQGKQEAIALCNRRIDAAVTLYQEGRIECDEYRASIDKNEREIAHWEARTAETERIALELAMCMDVVNSMACGT